MKMLRRTTRETFCMQSRLLYLWVMALLSFRHTLGAPHHTHSGQVWDKLYNTHHFPILVQWLSWKWKQPWAPCNWEWLRGRSGVERQLLPYSEACPHTSTAGFITPGGQCNGEHCLYRMIFIMRSTLQFFLWRHFQSQVMRIYSEESPPLLHQGYKDTEDITAVFYLPWRMRQVEAYSNFSFFSEAYLFI